VYADVIALDLEYAREPLKRVRTITFSWKKALHGSSRVEMCRVIISDGPDALLNHRKVVDGPLA